MSFDRDLQSDELPGVRDYEGWLEIMPLLYGEHETHDSKDWTDELDGVDQIKCIRTTIHIDESLLS